MKIYLARHGRTNYNDLGFCNADPAVDVHLTKVGFEQAHALADKFKQVKIDHIFVSELKRTQQTADAVNRLHNVDIEVDLRLNDGRSGYEGKHYTEYDAALDAVSDRWNARFNDGESIEDIKARVSDFIDDLRTKNYGSVLIVTSQWIIFAFFAVLQGLSNEEAWSLEVEQGSCAELELSSA